MIVEVALLISKLYDVPEADDYSRKDAAPKEMVSGDCFLGMWLTAI